jgi:spoIIIJ-associated protein
MREQQDVSAQQVGDEARKFIDELVAAFAFTGTTELIEDGDDLEVRVHGENLGLLVGPRGTTLQAVQDLARVASQRRLGDHDTRLRVDIGGYRQRRKEALDRFAIQMADEVKQSGVARVLEPMSSADRKIVHDALSEVEGIGTRSEGDDPYRRVVITPAND